MYNGLVQYGLEFIEVFSVFWKMFFIIVFMFLQLRVKKFKENCEKSICRLNISIFFLYIKFFFLMVIKFIIIILDKNMKN